MIMQQLEFPFTRTGRLQAYNIKQKAHMQSTYYKYLQNSDLEHSDSRWRAWEMMYVESGMATCYADEHSDAEYEKTVEKDNDRVKRRFETNQLFKPRSLDELIF